MVHIQCVVRSFIHSYQTSQKYGQSIDTRAVHEDGRVVAGLMQIAYRIRHRKADSTGEAHKQQSKAKQGMLWAREAIDRGKQKQISEIGPSNARAMVVGKLQGREETEVGKSGPDFVVGS